MKHKVKVCTTRCIYSTFIVEAVALDEAEQKLEDNNYTENNVDIFFDDEEEEDDSPDVFISLTVPVENDSKETPQ